MNGGYFREAQAWRSWLVRAIAGSPTQMQVMYGLAGERRLTEWEVPWLAGYQRLAPVRVGNAAHAQLQLDVFGEVMDALYQARRGGLDGTQESWALQGELLRHLEEVWREPDSGMWEMRGPPQHFTYSKVMAWVAFDRAVKTAEEFHLEGPGRTLERAARRSYRPMSSSMDTTRSLKVSCRRTARSSSMPACYCCPRWDLFAPMMRVSSAHWTRSNAGCSKADSCCAMTPAHTDDGLPAGEGAFLACSFWLVDAYVMVGRKDQARKLFERLLALRNDVGLLAEEYDPVACRLTGNFPQAFSHVALIGSAYNLFHADKPAEQRAGHRAKSV